MRFPARRFKALVATLLLWQLGGSLVATGPALAANGALGSTAQCHEHGAPGHAGPTQELRLPHAQSGTPTCCDGANLCDCGCAQTSSAIAPMIAMTLPVVARLDHVELRSPPVLRRMTELFRPPI